MLMLLRISCSVSLFYFVLKGVGKKVKVRELMAIASADEDDNHVISVRKYGSLQQAIKKAVELKIGK